MIGQQANCHKCGQEMDWHGHHHPSDEKFCTEIARLKAEVAKKEERVRVLEEVLGHIGTFAARHEPPGPKITAIYNTCKQALAGGKDGGE